MVSEQSRDERDMTFRSFLDSQQYSRTSILRYERIFGAGFVSTGGLQTTQVIKFSSKADDENIILRDSLSISNWDLECVIHCYSLSCWSPCCHAEPAEIMPLFLREFASQLVPDQRVYAAEMGRSFWSCLPSSLGSKCSTWGAALGAAISTWPTSTGCGPFPAWAAQLNICEILLGLLWHRGDILLFARILKYLNYEVAVNPFV